MLRTLVNIESAWRMDDAKPKCLFEARSKLARLLILKCGYKILSYRIEKMMNQPQKTACWNVLRSITLATFALLSTALLMTTASAQSGTKSVPQQNTASGSGTKSAGSSTMSAGTMSAGSGTKSTGTMGTAGSGTKSTGTMAAGSGTMSAGSGTKVANSAPALQGYCPVCIIEMKQWMKGSPQFAAKHDGKTYLFPSEEQKQMFLKAPAKYTPALGGDCVVGLVEMNKRVAGSPQHAARHNDRLYLFVNEKTKGMFLTNTQKYADADLAMGGKCTVCRVEMNQDVDGMSQYTSVHQGMRYQFPGDKQQQMFNQNPAKYSVTK